MELKNTTELVKQVLETVPAARNSDERLYIEVLKLYSDEAGVRYESWPFGDALMSLHRWGVPPYETVSRCRRRVQAKFPELRADAAVEDFRAEKQAGFKEWAVN